MNAEPKRAGLTSSLDLEPGDPMTLADLRRWARDLFGPSEDLALLITELVANARQHGTNAPIRVEISRAANSLAIMVTNQGRPWPPVSVPDSAPLDASSPRGRGLKLAKMISDELRIEQSDTTVKVAAVISQTPSFYPYEFDPHFEGLLRLFGVRSDRDGVRIEDGHLSASFGFLNLDTPIANITSAQLTGPYRWFKALGPRLSAADRGLTFGTTTAKGVCLTFETPIPAVIGPWPHPGLTLTVGRPEQFVAAIERARL